MHPFVESLESDPKLAKHVAYRGLAPGREARLAEPLSGWPAGARQAASALGVAALWSHQAAALDHVAAGRNALLATPTASGKTLAYLLSFLARRAVDPGARAVFVYPLKALARDQLATIRRFLAPLGYEPEEAAEVYDGDTSDNERRRIRRRPPAVLVTNPDMLHLGILPAHDTWSGFLEQLALVVLDEAHIYRGIFGAHVHHVLRRLLRLARLHGARPQLLAGSATIGEPRAFVETLAGEPFEVVDESGAPAAPRHLLFVAPNGVSPYTLAVHALARAVDAGHRAIAFTKARRITELMQQWLRQSRPDIAGRVASYRSGYLPEERREIERRLFSGQLGGVISTSALEAGIDVGGLDVCVLVGYPGSLATAWQRIGRTGRKDRESLALLVALPDALDRFVVDHPGHFLSGTFERVVLDPRNDTVADAHLEAAGAERSLAPEDVRFLHGAGGAARVARLVESGRLVEADAADASLGPRWFALRRQPQRDIALRSAAGSYELKRASDGRALGTLDGGRVWFEGHPGAIYLHAGQSYRVLALDAETKSVTLEPADVEWFTQVYARKETEILERLGERPVGPARLAWGRVKVTTFVEGYSRRRLFSQEEISRHPLEAPPQELESIACWWELPEGLLALLVDGEFHPAGSLHALEHAAIGLFPLLAICDRWDLGGISYAHHPQLDVPAVFIYDGWPGGVGLARTGYERAEELLARTRDLLASCPCDDGCPACVHSPKCGSGNHPLDKAGALVALEVLTGVRPLESARASADDVRTRLATHRSNVHGGVRGGGALPDGFFPAPGGGTPLEAGGDSRDAPLEARVDSRDAPLEARVDRPDSALEIVALAGAPAAAVAIAELADATVAEAAGAAAPLALPAAWRWDFPLPGDLVRPDEGRWLFFDLETLRGADEVGGWQRIDRMGLALAVVLDAATGEFLTFREADAPELIERLVAADRVVGFNQERFDFTVLRGYRGGSRLAGCRSLDLLARLYARMGFRVGLGHLVTETLGARKAADGLQSLRWVREGRFDLIERYCREDVLLTAALWAHGRSRGYVVFKDAKTGQRGRIAVRW
jgi:DEAD/DEAH box helicase domain-containing protein